MSTSLWDLYCRLDDNRPAFILDSSQFNAGTGRFSFMGYGPDMLFRSRQQTVEIVEGNRRTLIQADPLDYLHQVLTAWRRPPEVKASFPLQGGLIGYLGYDLKHQIESLPALQTDNWGLYDQYWGVYKTIVVEESGTGRKWVVGSGRKAVNRTWRELSRLPPLPDTSRCFRIGSIRSNYDRSRYLEAVKKVQEYIRSGDVYQVNLSQQLTFPFQGNSRALYQALRQTNTCCFGAHLHFPEYDILSMSPERLIKMEHGRIETRPIKGTRPRSRNAEENRRRAWDLFTSEKERAELLMIVDLERNDFSRICTPGSVKVSRLFSIHEYDTVLHMDATIEGCLKKGLGLPQIIRAVFPGGSVTGAPKIRAMQVIEELEPDRRGVYTGSIGYLDFAGNCDLNIAIRTAVIKANQGYYNAGGGLVIDSVPELEYRETWAKSRALLRIRKEGGRYEDLVERNICRRKSEDLAGQQ